jgi:tetratricopeptide (TPR) repeat protein
MVYLTLAVVLFANPTQAELLIDQRERDQLARAEFLFRQHDYRNALLSFQQAYIRQPNPVAALGTAECHDRLGEKAYAAYYYRAYLRRSPNAANSLEIAQRIGDALYPEIRKGLALLEIESLVPARAIVDGRPYDSFPIAIFVPPGEHEVLVEFANGRQKHTVLVRKGRSTAYLMLHPPISAPAVGGAGMRDDP